jgi:hypothetical protein
MMSQPLWIAPRPKFPAIPAVLTVPGTRKESPDLRERPYTGSSADDRNSFDTRELSGKLVACPNCRPRGLPWPGFHDQGVPPSAKTLPTRGLNAVVSFPTLDDYLTHLRNSKAVHDCYGGATLQSANDWQVPACDRQCSPRDPKYRLERVDWSSLILSLQSRR